MPGYGGIAGEPPGCGSVAVAGGVVVSASRVQLASRRHDMTIAVNRMLFLSPDQGGSALQRKSLLIVSRAMERLRGIVDMSRW